MYALNYRPCSPAVKSCPAEPVCILNVTRARMTQLPNLLLLAPGIKEPVLRLPATENGRARLAEHTLRRVALEPDWARQREEWAGLTTHAR